MIDERFLAMGCDCRLIVEGDDQAPAAAARARAAIAAVDERLSRFDAASELCELNADPREDVPASPLLRAAVAAALDAARRSAGLVDPTLLGRLERAGYDGDWDPARRAALREALAAAPARHRARPSATAAWRRVHVEPRRGVVVRPSGLRLDLGGIGKGLAADLAVRAAAGQHRVLVDCGGDLVVGGRAVAVAPFAVGVADPFGDGLAGLLQLAGGAVATSGIDNRLWWRIPGTPAHHLLDPSTGAPAFTGVVAASAIGRSGVEAERLAKSALLSGPVLARRTLAPLGGVLVLDDGHAEWIGPLARPAGVAA